MIEISVDAAMKEVQAKQVRYVWKMDKLTYARCRRLADYSANYLWIPDLANNSPGTFLGYQISIVDEESFELVIVPPQGARVLAAGDNGQAK